MPAALDTLGLNFRFLSDAQTRKGETQQVQSATDSFARIMVRNVALRTSDRYYQSAKQTLTKQVRLEVRKEINKMASMVGRFLVQPERANGPKGVVTSAQTGGAVAEASRAIFGGGVGAFDLSSSDARWPERQLKYMRWKNDQGYGKNWWSNTGNLGDALRDPSTYYQNFGPISVLFTRTKAQPAKTDNKTTSGRTGRITETFTVGRLEVLVFNKITPAMLPSLASGNVKDVTPKGKAKLPRLLPREIGGPLLQRSSGEFGRQREYRPVLEPFLSYYLTRAIPNAVFLRTERAFGKQSRFGSALA